MPATSDDDRHTSQGQPQSVALYYFHVKIHLFVWFLFKLSFCAFNLHINVLD